MNKNPAIEMLKELYLSWHRMEYPDFPEYARTVPKYTDKTANGQARCIIDFLRLNGHQAERINTTGLPVDTRRIVTDVIGRQRQIGSLSWRKTPVTKGSADISATIAGRSVKIEVKAGNDRQSEAQKQYQRDIEAAGGTYIIARTFAGFVESYNELILMIRRNQL